MSILSIIKKIKTVLEAEATQLTDVKTKDGLILSFEDEITTGIEIFVTDETGRTPAPDGDYILEDGKKLVVVDGKISEIIEPAPVPVEVPVEVPVKQTELELPELQEKILKLEADNIKLFQLIADLAKNINKKDFEEEVKMSIKKEPLIEKHEKSIKNNFGISNILKNMYK